MVKMADTDDFATSTDHTKSGYDDEVTRIKKDIYKIKSNITISNRKSLIVPFARTAAG